MNQQQFYEPQPDDRQWAEIEEDYDADEPDQYEDLDEQK